MEKLVTHWCSNLRQMGILMHKSIRQYNIQTWHHFFSNIPLIYYVIKRQSCVQFQGQCVKWICPWYDFHMINLCSNILEWIQCPFRHIISCKVLFLCSSLRNSFRVMLLFQSVKCPFPLGCDGSYHCRQKLESDRWLNKTEKVKRTGDFQALRANCPMGGGVYFGVMGVSWN